MRSVSSVFWRLPGLVDLYMYFSVQPKKLVQSWKFKLPWPVPSLKMQRHSPHQWHHCCLQTTLRPISIPMPVRSQNKQVHRCLEQEPQWRTILSGQLSETTGPPPDRPKRLQDPEKRFWHKDSHQSAQKNDFGKRILIRWTEELPRMWSRAQAPTWGTLTGDSKDFASTYREKFGTRCSLLRCSRKG